MFFFIGAMAIGAGSSIVLIVHLAIFCILILATFARLIYEYHKNSLS
jgi:hypothetical protein